MYNLSVRWIFSESFGTIEGFIIEGKGDFIAIFMVHNTPIYGF